MLSEVTPLSSQAARPRRRLPAADVPAVPLVTGSGPRYHRIADQVRARILDGDLAPGQRLPSEIELMDAYTVSRNTIRLALRRLADEGLVVAGQGRGTFVRGRPRRLVWDLLAAPSQQWAADIAAAGHRLSQEVEVSIVPALAGPAVRLGVEPATAVVCRRQVQVVDGDPCLLTEEYLPAELAHGTPLAHSHDVPDIGAVLAGLGAAVTRVRHELVTRPPSRVEIQTLRLSAAVPVLEHTRIGYTASDRPVQVTVTILPGDRHLVTIDVSDVDSESQW